MALYSLFIRCFDVKAAAHFCDADCFVGAFSSRSAAETALDRLDLTEYLELIDDDEPELPFGFVVSHRLGATLTFNAIKKIGDKRASDMEDAWQSSPPGKIYHARVAAELARADENAIKRLFESPKNRLAKKRSIEECLSDYVDSDDDDSVDL